MAVDPQNSVAVYAWTHMAIYKSLDGGVNGFEIASQKEKSAGVATGCFDLPGSVAIAPVIPIRSTRGPARLVAVCSRARTHGEAGPC